MLEDTGTDLEAGWLPIGVNSGCGQTRIEWADFGSEPLAEPLLSQSAARLRTQATRSRLKFTALDALLQITPDVLPRGFIFHVSRCGSTLVSNSMRAFSGISVIAEPAADRTQVFRDDRQEKQIAASPTIRAEVAQWALDRYCALIPFASQW